MEYIDIIDENGNLTEKKEERSIIHKNGLWHKTIHVWIINDNNELLIQQRSSNKEINSDKWTTSVSGHLDSGDTNITGALREIQEEIGLTVNSDELIYIGSIKEHHVHRADYINNELVDIFIVYRNINLNSLTFQKDEVQDAKYISLQQFKKLVLTNDSSLAEHKDVYLKTIEYLEKK